MGFVRIGFISFRVSGTDGVSLEAERWRTILLSMGHEVTFIAGELDRSGTLLPSLHFTHPDVFRVHQTVVDNDVNYRKVEKEIFSLAGEIEGELRALFRQNRFDRLVVANVFSLPIHFPLAVALERVIHEYGIVTVARHHDFWWERKRYLKSHCFEFFKRFFPPAEKNISHVVINSIAKRELKERTGLTASVIGDCFDFLSRANRVDEYVKRWREDFSIQKEDIVFLQATRIVPRKRIELSIELVERLSDPHVVLVLAGYAGDESSDYLDKIKDLARKAGIRAKFIANRVGSRREVLGLRRTYTLWDCFANCDLVTYPSEVEGFGNQFIEAVYFKKPIFVNRYPVYRTDIEPLGFKTVAINGEVSDTAVEKVRLLLRDFQKVNGMTEENFKLGKRHFSFEAVEKKLESLGF